MNLEDKKILKKCLHNQSSSDLLFFSTDHFNVTFDKHPLVEGHLNIQSKNHCRCGGEIPDTIFHELNRVKIYVRELLDLKYGTASFYEQGHSEHCHFQLHALPLNGTISASLNERFHMLKMQNFDEIKEMYDRFGGYIFFESSTEDKFFFPTSQHSLSTSELRALIDQTISQSENTFERTPKPTSDLIEQAKIKLNTLKQLGVF